LKNIVAKENFDTFSFAYYSDNHIDPVTGRSSLETMKNAHAIAREFVDTFRDEFRNLFLYGDTGIGKTFLSNCIAKELIDKSFSVIYLTSYELFDTLAKSKFEKDDTAEAMASHIFDCDLLIIDETDAFPFSGNEVLLKHFEDSIKGNYIMMSATPLEWMKEKIKKEDGVVLSLLKRFHGHKIVEPIMKITPFLQELEVIAANFAKQNRDKAISYVDDLIK
jgi:DNA replication protein DnaC